MKLSWEIGLAPISGHVPDVRFCSPGPVAMVAAMEREDQLYPPVKAMLVAQGYEVKGEVGAADVMARRGGEDPVIVS